MADNSKTIIFKNRLEELMHEKYITKAQFCRDIEISKPTLDKWLNIDNDILPTLANTLRIAEKYNVSIDWLTGNEVAPVNDNVEEDIDIVKKTFEAIMFLDAHYNIELEIFNSSNSIDYSFYNTRLIIKSESISYFVQEYNKIKSILNDSNMADFKGVIWERFLQRFKEYVYSDKYKSIILLNDHTTTYDYEKSELTIVERDEIFGEVPF